MKNIALSLLLIFAFITSTGANSQSEEQGSSTTLEQQESIELNESKDGIHFNLDFDDDELSTDEKFEIAKKAIKDAVGGEFDKDTEIEIEGLTDQQKEEIIEALEEGFSIQTDGIPTSVLAVAIPAVVLSLGMPIIIVLLVLWFSHKKRRQKMDVINAYLQAEREVPDQVLNAFDVGSKSSLRRGIMLVGVGLGFLAALHGFDEPEVASLGLIPLFIGLARLLYWFLEDRKA